MIAVYDNVLPNPEAYRREALTHLFGVVLTAAGQFKGVALCADPRLGDWLRQTVDGVSPGLTFFRKSPKAQVEPNWIHNDIDMGDVTVILYLNPTPPVGDGTSFWRYKASATDASRAPFGGSIGQPSDAWECYQTVPAVFNRAVVFSAPLFHSRGLFDNYGEGDDARLIQVLFAKETR